MSTIGGYEHRLLANYAESKRRLRLLDKPAPKPTRVKRQSPPPERDFLFVSSAVLADLPTGATGPLKWRAIVAEVCEGHDITFNSIRSRRRYKPIVKARHEAFYRLSSETTFSLPQIGRLLGGFDHTTVLHGIRMHKRRVIDAPAVAV